MSDLSVGFDLEDGVSGPTSAMLGVLTRLDSTLGKIEAKFAAIDKSQKAVASSTKKAAAPVAKQAWNFDKWKARVNKAAEENTGWQGSVARMGMAAASLSGPLAVAGAAIGGVAVVTTGAAAAAGKWVVSTLSAKQNALAGLTAMTGSADEANRLFSAVTTTGQKLGISNAEAVDRARKIMGAGFGAGDVPMVISATADITARGGSADGFLSGIEAAYSEGVVNYGALKKLAKVATLELPELIDTIAKRTGRSVEGVTAALKSPTGLKPNEGVNGILELLANKGGGKLGTTAVTAAKTLSGRIALAMQIPTNILQGMDITRFKGFAAIEETLKRMTAEFGPGTLATQKLESAFLRVDAAIGAVFSRWTGPDGAANVVKDIETIASAIELIAASIKLLAKVPGVLGGVLRMNPMTSPIMTGIDTAGQVNDMRAAQVQRDQMAARARAAMESSSAWLEQHRQSLAAQNHVEISVNVDASGAKDGKDVAASLGPAIKTAVYDALADLGASS